MPLLPLVVAAQAGWAARLFPSPTGASALEEYARAADVVAGPGFDLYANWGPRRGQPTDVPSVRATRRAAPGDRRDAALSQRDAERENERARAARFPDFLAFCRSEAQAFGGALDLVHAGNAKPVGARVDLDPIDYESVGLVNLEIRAAHVEFADGRPRAAVGHLLDGLTFADNLERSTVRGGAATLGRSAILSMFARSLDRLGLADCLEVDRAVRALLGRSPAGKAEYAALGERWQADIGAFAASMRPASAEPYPENRALVARLRAMTPETFGHAVEEARSFAVRTVAGAAARLDGPESGWTAPDLGETKPPEGDATVPAALARAALQVNFYGLQFDAVYRTRLRLLDLSALARAFWFRNGRYPASLAELGPKVGDDPLGGGAFGYELRPDGFVASSAGTARTGRIVLDPRSPENGRPGL